MSKGGHALVAATVGAAITLAVPHCAMLGIATALAGSVPDSIEGVVGFGPAGERRSLLPHRTLSHSPWPWVLVLVVGLLLPPAATPWGPVAMGKVLAGIAVGALLHLALDLLSPMGIPCGNPFGRRVSLGPYRSVRGSRYLYRTSTVEEWQLIVPFAILLFAELGVLAARIGHGGVPDLGAVAAAVSR